MGVEVNQGIVQSYAMEAGYRWRILFVEDEEFTRSLLTSLLEKSGVDVRSCSTAAEAIAALEDFEPHVVIADLDLGLGPSGAHLLTRVEQVAPWVGMVILSAHASPSLAIRVGVEIPEGTIYLVKSEVSSADDILSAVEAAVERRVVREHGLEDDRIVLSQTHGEILRLIAEGYSNAGIAKERSTTVRAAEGMVQRLFLALGLRSDPDRNARVLAVRMWQQGKVVIR